MREPHRPQHIYVASGGDQTTTPTAEGPLSPEIKLTTTENSTTPQLDEGQFITPPYASDVRIQKIKPKTNLDKPTQCVIPVHPHTRKSKTYALQIVNKMPSTALSATPTANNSHSKPHCPPRRANACSSQGWRTSDQPQTQSGGSRGPGLLSPYDHGPNASLEHLHGCTIYTNHTSNTG